MIAFSSVSNAVVTVFVVCVVVLASTHAYHHYLEGKQSVEQGCYAVDALRDYPRLEAIPYLNAGFQHAKHEAKKSPVAIGIMKMLMESKIYDIYNISPLLFWAAAFMLVVLKLLQEYKLRSEIALAERMAQSASVATAHMSSVVNAAAARAASAAPVDPETLGKALRSAMREERREDRRDMAQHQHNHYSPAIAHAASAATTSLTAKKTRAPIVIPSPPSSLVNQVDS